MAVEMPDIDLEGIDQSDAAKVARAEAWAQAHADTDTRGDWIPGVDQTQGAPYSISGPFGTRSGVASPTARPPVTPPAGMVSGASMPDLSGAYAEAFKHLPVAQALQAVEAAKRYQGTRGYQADLQAGAPAEKAFAKWAPMLLPSSAAMRPPVAPKLPPIFAPTPGGEGYTYNGKFYPKREPRPVTRQNAEGQIVQVLPDGTERVVDAAKHSPVTIKLPEVKAKPAVPGVPEVKHWFRANEPAIPPTAAVEARPALTVKAPAGFVDSRLSGIMPNAPKNKAPVVGDEDETTAVSEKVPSEGDIAYLKANPSKKALFEKKFGAGSADEFLNSK